MSTGKINPIDLEARKNFLAFQKKLFKNLNLHSHHTAVFLVSIWLVVKIDSVEININL